MPIESISDTARWVAFYRAMESERPDAVFVDPYARRLAGERGEAIVRAMPRGRAYAWPMIVRTAVMDEILVRVVRDEKADAVVNLAAGLDARPYRLDLPAGLRWTEVDLPGILDYKERILDGETPRCRLERVRLDLREREARRSLFDRLAASGSRVVVVAEGLMVYLSREEASGLADDLARPPAIRWWLLDIASPWLLKRMQRVWGKRLEHAGAALRFAPEEGTAFYAARGWREREYRSTLEEAHRLKREMALAPLFRFLGRFQSAKRREEMRRIAGIVLLERATSA